MKLILITTLAISNDLRKTQGYKICKIVEEVFDLTESLWFSYIESPKSKTLSWVELRCVYHKHMRVRVQVQLSSCFCCGVQDTLGPRVVCN